MIVDGSAANHSGEPVAAFLSLDGQTGGALIADGTGHEVEVPVHTTGVRVCSVESLEVPIVEPGVTRRFSLSLAAGGGEDTTWVAEAVRTGTLPGISLGPFAFGGCGLFERPAPLPGTWRFHFSPTQLPEAEPRDYYPFGAPTTQEVSVSGRRYWSGWLPRVD